MKNFLWALLFLSLSTMAKADITVRYCFSDLDNQCIIVTKVTVFVPPALYYQTGDQLIDEFHRAGYDIMSLPPEMYSAFMAANPRVPTVQKSAEDLRDQINETGEDLLISAGECGGLVLGCVGAVAGTPYMPWWGIWVARVTCTGAGLTCSRIIGKYQKWQKLKEEYQQELKDNPPPKTEAGDPGIHPPLLSSEGSGMSIFALCNKYKCQDPLNHRPKVTWWETPPPKIN